MFNKFSKLGKGAKIGICISIVLLVFGFVKNSRMFDMVSPKVMLIVFSLILTIVAKWISYTKGDEGKMSKTYKMGYIGNRRFYRIFCLAVMIMPLGATLTGGYLDIAAMYEKILEIIFIILIGIGGCGWLITEVIRRDFPWGIFRVIERLFYAAMMTIGVYIGTTFLVEMFERYPVVMTTIFATVLGSVILFIAWVEISLAIELIYETYLKIRFPNEEERKKYIEKQLEERRKENRRKRILEQHEKSLREPYENAATTFWGDDYKGRDENGKKLSLRRLEDGDYVDEKGNRYKKKDDGFWF